MAVYSIPLSFVGKIHTVLCLVYTVYDLVVRVNLSFVFRVVKRKIAR